MVSFRSLVAGVALIASPVMAALTLDQVTNGVRRLTAISDNIDINAGSINAGIISDLNDIASSATTLANGLSTTPAVGSSAAAAEVFSAFDEFAFFHKLMLQTLINKANLLSKVPGVGQPVANAIRTDGNGIDALAIRLRAYAPSRGPDIALAANSLRSTLDEAISKYTSLL